MLLVDASGSGQFGSVGRFKNELAAELCAVLAFSAIKNHDKVGLIIFTDEVEKYVPPKKGKRHILHVISEVLFFKPRRRGTNIESAIQFLSSISKKRTVTFVVSDFQTAGFERSLQIANKRHDVIAVQVEDPREHELPDVGILRLQDAETGEILLVDTADNEFRKKFSLQTARETEARNRAFKQISVDQIRVSTEKGYLDPLIRFFRTRERRR
jgi:uncharacterized protein (DUF58 family)